MNPLKLLLKLAGLPFKLGTKRLPHGAHVTRYFMYETLRSAINDPLHGAGKKTLSISHSDVLIGYLGIENAEIIEANYPEHSAVDLSAFPSGQFDFVVSDQVLEHVRGNPQAVFDETYRLLKPGGVAVHTTCLINPIHGYPSDFWRFTPDCLALLAEKFSSSLVGGFGNRAIWIVDLMGLRMVPVPHTKWHPLNWVATINVKNWPVSTWVVATK